MLLESLKSSYLQYKLDTDAVASWLASTATRCGYPKDLLLGGNNELGQRQPRISSKRPKGKARKKAREAKAGNSLPDQSSQTQNEGNSKLPTYTIAIKEFVTLAEYIAGKTSPSIKIPRTFVTALNQAISVRRNHGMELGSQQPDVQETRDSDERHGYFIGILERVHDVLRPRMPADEMPGSQADAAQKLANRFDGLNVEEPSEAFLQSPDVSLPDSEPSIPEANYEAGRLQDFEEAFLSFTLLIADLNKMRTVIIQTWEGYKQGIFNLVSASLTTNTAFDLARSMEQEMKPLLDKHGGSEKMLQLYFLGLCMENGEDQAYKERPGDAMNFKMYEQTKNIYWPTYQLLNAFIPMVDSRHIPQYRSGFYGTYVPTSNRETKSAREKFQEDQQVLMEILPEFCYLSLRVNRMPAEDELTRGLREAFKTHELPFWLIFAGQVFLDIHHTLRDDIEKGYYDLYRIATIVNHNIQTTLEFHKALRVDTWPRQNDMALKEVQATINTYIIKDPIQPAKVKLNRSPGKSFLLQQWHPVYCGLWLYNLQALYQEIGVTFAGAWGSILYTYHLYNALQQEKLLEKRWKDMELFMMLHGEQIFPGGRPSTPEDYLKRFTLSMGYSASSFARYRRDTGRLEASKKGPKGFHELAPVLQMFKHRFCDGSERIELTKQDLGSILAKSKWEVELNEKDKKNDETLTMVHNDRLANDKGSNEDQQKVEIVHLLQGLRMSVQAEYLEFSFDYLVFHQVCWNVLRLIKDTCEEDLRSMYGPGCIERENQLPFIVGYILMAATNTNKVGSLIKKKSEEVTSALMVQAAVACSELISMDGFGETTSRVLTEQYGLPFEFEEESSSD